MLVCVPYLFTSCCSNYDIACFSTKVANEAFRDLSTASHDASLILLHCVQSAISHLETIPEAYITKTLKPLGLEKLWHRFISKLLEKFQVSSFITLYFFFGFLSSFFLQIIHRSLITKHSTQKQRNTSHTCMKGCNHIKKRT